jgi:hypothetical protein
LRSFEVAAHIMTLPPPKLSTSSMTLDPEVRISKRIDAVTQTRKSPLVQQIKGLDIPKLAKNLVQRRERFDSVDERPGCTDLVQE